ncbi:Histidine-specific methyltransferase EgtD [Legionella massiliensis]|uniref:Histidine-specific methyltransferase EgtD n=1 Tax=Legionella massiliensis TaxID=1034943 RepID=A0A078L331_9GAMM|nr:L-histidine N(alpha)-methyltransferase [Legionella massiliensis]CDZ78514.1 Histidine-specific methyltransferase EgtD [Legionella massiliensis]CEE14252.1 Histidine-specific methyltransferase EgtD [Legionella massiliensis]
MSAKFETLMSNTHISHDKKQEFIHDIRLGLSKTNKAINSKYFYDEKGSDLFNQITRHPDYYLTGCELEILSRYKQELATILTNDDFNLIELGPGEGIKTRLLIDEFLSEQLSFSYFTIDISAKYLTQIVDKFNQQLPNLETIALNSDYLNGVKWLGSHSNKRNFLLFLGSSIGNFSLNSSKEFLGMLHDFLNPGDYVLIGFDLLKDIDVLLRAYNDSAGITRDFNLNLLMRMNNELGGNFNVDSFYHYGTYNIYAKAMESYLVSNKAQIVYIDSLKKSFNFKEFEAIHVESSQKYSLTDVDNLARSSRFKVIKNFTDSKQYFLNSLWQA